jgi:predicted dehydrogenase
MLPIMTAQLRWGILGTGNIARQFAAGLIASGRGRPVAAGSRNRESGEEFARTYSLAAAYASYEELLADRDVDVVYNSLPNSLHHQWTIAALKAGKHVLCEKPLAMDAAEAEEMFDVARRNGRLLMEAFMYRCHPQTLAVLEAVRSGAIGELRLVRTSFCFNLNKPGGNVRLVRELGGGALMDVGCYCISLSRALAAAEPAQIRVAGHLHAAGIDDLAAGSMVFPSGMVADFTCGFTVQADNTAWVYGTEGSIHRSFPPRLLERLFP